MLPKRSIARVAFISLLALFLSSCYRHYYPPFNNFLPYNRAHVTTASLIKQLKKYQIDIIQYGDTITFIVPTDRYFMFNSARINQFCFVGLATLIRLIKTYPSCCPIYVGGFTNDVSSRAHKKKLTQGQAEAMITLLWAQGVPAQRLNPEGYGDSYPVSENKLIHGSAQNRRLEIQIINNCSLASGPQSAPVGYIK